MKKKEEMRSLVSDLADLAAKIDTEASWLDEMLNDAAISPPDRVLKVMEREALDVANLCRELQELVGV